MKLYFLNVRDVYHYDSDYNRYDPYYLFTDDLTLLKAKCVEKWEDEYESIPYIYEVNTKNLELTSINDERVKKILETSRNLSLNEFLEIIEEEGFETAVYDGEFDEFNGITSLQFCDGLTDFPIWDPEKGEFVPKGIVLFAPKSKTDYPTNISEERLDDFVDYLEDVLTHTSKITMTLKNDEDVDEDIELPLGVYCVMLLYDIELGGESYYNFMDFLKQENESLFNKIVKNNGVYDNEKQINTAIERFNIDNINKYTFVGWLYDIFKDEYNLEYILENYERAL